MDPIELFTNEGHRDPQLRSQKDVILALEELYARLNEMRKGAFEPKDKQAIYAKQLDVIKAAASNLNYSEGELLIDEVLNQLEGVSSFEKEIFLTRLANRRMDFLS